MRSIELFSGAGGLAKGLELAGLQHAALVEYDKHACRTLAENFGPQHVRCCDIRRFQFEEFEDVDVVCGGPPCQPFSLGGKHRAYNDERDMFPSAIRAIEVLRPKVFIFENVKGLLRSSFASYFEYITLRLAYPGCTCPAGCDWQDHLETLRSIGQPLYIDTKYNVQFKLLNAADFGIPQVRERVFIVGVRSDLDLVWSFPQPTHSEDRLLWEQHITGEYWKRNDLPEDQSAEHYQQRESVDRLKTRFGMFEPEKKAWRTVREALQDLPDPLSSHGIRDHVFKPGARSYAGHTGSSNDLPAKTLKAGAHGVPGGENMLRHRDGSVRYFTVHEAKLLQTFPSDYIFHGSWGEAMRQIGNAVPVKLANILGDQVARMIFASTPQLDCATERAV